MSHHHPDVTICLEDDFANTKPGIGCNLDVRTRSACLSFSTSPSTSFNAPIPQLFQSKPLTDATRHVHLKRCAAGSFPQSARSLDCPSPSRQAEFPIEGLGIGLAAQEVLKCLHFVLAAATLEDSVTVASAFFGIHGVFSENREKHVCRVHLGTAYEGTSTISIAAFLAGGHRSGQIHTSDTRNNLHRTPRSNART